MIGAESHAAAPRPTPGKPIKVVVVDDSVLMRNLLRTALEADGDIAVAGAAREAYEARDIIKSSNPDVVTLDIDMPGMNGLQFLEKIMTLRPMPVVMVSALTLEGAETTLNALELGAVDFVAKPMAGAALRGFGDQVRAKVREAARARVRVPAPRPAAAKPAPVHPAPQSVAPSKAEPALAGAAAAPLKATPAAARPSKPATPRTDTKTSSTLQRIAESAPPKSNESPRAGSAKPQLLAIGASTGGVAAIGSIVSRLPKGLPPTVIVVHMPDKYTARFAQRLAQQTGHDVAEATDGERLRRGMLRIAPGDRHLQVARRGGDLAVVLDDGPAVSGHKPSVDVMFHSVAELLGAKALGAILTGMGRDGAKGLLAMRRSGAVCLGEAESSCVVYGMPRVANELGAVAEEHDLSKLPARIVELSGGVR